MCCKCCSPQQKKIWVFGCGTFCILFSLILGLLWPTLSLQLLHSQLVLKEGSKTYETWLETPIPIYLELYLFDWTNTNDLNKADVKPNFEQKGPYVFREVHKRVDIVWHENATVSFNQIRTWFFEPEMSNGTLDDKITNLNVISSTVAYTLRNANRVFKMVANLMLRDKGGSLFVTKTARELLFDGYDDQLLDFLKGLNTTAISIPFKKFGWFVERNNSKTYDGRFNIFTGADNINKLGIMDLWNEQNRSPFYRDNCGMINGTTGEVWPPIDVKKEITVFATDVCRSVSVVPESEYSRFGIVGHKWVGDERVFDNGQNYPEAGCFCTSEKKSCPDLPSGVLNVSDCKFGAPAFVSYPHFYLAEPSFLVNITGLKPEKEKHQFSVAIEPTTGIPLEIKAQLQINVLLQPIKGLTMFENVPKLMVPMLYFRQVADLNEEFAAQAKVALMLPSFGIYTSYAFAVIGILLIIVGIILTIYKLWGTKENSLQTSESRRAIIDDDDKMIR